VLRLKLKGELKLLLRLQYLRSHHLKCIPRLSTSQQGGNRLARKLWMCLWYFRLCIQLSQR